MRRYGALCGVLLLSAAAAAGARQPGTLTFSSSAYSVAQQGGAVTITVNRIGGAAGAVTVYYSTAHNTATFSDYSSQNGTLKWADGDVAAKTFSVRINDKLPFVGTKWFTVDINHPTGGAALGTPHYASVNIQGSSATGGGSAAGTAALSAPSYRIAQSSGSLLVTVERTAGSSGPISVGYGTGNNTAKAGIDYTAAAGVLRWASGETQPKSFAVKINKSAGFTGTRSFAVAVSGPGGGAVIGNPATALVSIVGTGPVAPPVNGAAMGKAAAARLLMQGTFGATLEGIAAASQQSYAQWFDAQQAASATYYAPSVPTQNAQLFPVWLRTAVSGEDQLRQRLAFALSELFVDSGSTMGLNADGNSLAVYYDILVRNALGNYRTLLEQVTLNPNMGLFLSMLRNDKPDAASGVHADENYARESMQLFSVGLVRLNADGTAQLDAKGAPLPTYGLPEVQALARVYTGWGSKPVSHPFGDESWQYDLDKLNPMVAYESHHDTGAKTILGGVLIPAGGSAESDLKMALDALFNHPNVGPFLGKQLIQRLVTSNPSPGYVARVAAVFDNDGGGVRGNLSAVARAILTDPEALQPGGTAYGKLREPLLRLTNLWRAFGARDAANSFAESNILIYSQSEFDEEPMNSPGVFNFFRPDYMRAGPLTNARMAAPEFQITNENTLVLTQNRLAMQAYQFIDSGGAKHAGPDYDAGNTLSASSVMLYTAPWEGYAATPAALVDQLNLVFMAGRMPEAMQKTLADYITQIPPTMPWSRVVETASLLINSPQYAVQR